MFNDKVTLLDPVAKLLGNHGILILKILAKVKTDQVPVCYMNFGDHNVKFFKGTVVGNFEDTMGIIENTPHAVIVLTKHEIKANEHLPEHFIGEIPN